MVKLMLPDAAATEALGARVAALLSMRAGGLIHLNGSLGAGKTTLARGLLRATGVVGPIRSPTYTLMEPYEINGLEIIHLDLYRLAEADELLSLGLEDYSPERCWWLVEWPERGGDYLPAATLTVGLEVAPVGRLARLQAEATLMAACGFVGMPASHPIQP